MKVVQVDIIHGDKVRDDFMHACDIFEKGKILADYESYEVSGEPDLDKLTETMQKTFEQAGRVVAFVSIRTIDGVKNTKYPAYIKPEVQTISNGRSFGLFHKMLKQLGYTVETDEYVKVTSAKFLEHECQD